MSSLKLGSANKLIQVLRSKLLASRDNAIIHNKFILYFVFLISLGNLFYLSVERDFISISIFALIGFLTSFFSKNMLIILFIALTMTNILKYGANVVHEGASNMDEEDESSTKKKDKKDSDSKDKKDSESKDNKSSDSKEKKSDKTSGAKESMEDKPADSSSDIVGTLKSLSKIAESLRNK